MIKVDIIRDGQVTNGAQFASQAEADAWLSYHEGMKSFGEPSRTVQQQVEIAPAVVGENGEILVPAVTEFHEVVIPGSYEVVITDITAQVDQERINREALEYLASTDFYVIRFTEEGIPYPEEIKQARQAARERIVK